MALDARALWTESTVMRGSIVSRSFRADHQPLDIGWLNLRYLPLNL